MCSSLLFVNGPIDRSNVRHRARETDSSVMKHEINVQENLLQY